MEVIPEYEQLLAPHLDDLKRYCLFLTRSKWDGEDLLQDTLLKSLAFFLHTEPYLDIKPFLFRVAKNLWIDACRKKKEEDWRSSISLKYFIRTMIMLRFAA